MIGAAGWRPAATAISAYLDRGVAKRPAVPVMKQREAQCGLAPSRHVRQTRPFQPLLPTFFKLGLGLSNRSRHTRGFRMPWSGNRHAVERPKPTGLRSSERWPFIDPSNLPFAMHDLVVAGGTGIWSEHQGHSWPSTTLAEMSPAEVGPWRGSVGGCRLCGSPQTQIGTSRMGCKAPSARLLNASAQTT